MNWRMLLLLAFLLPLPTGLAAQKKKNEKEKAEQPKIEMTFREKIKPLGPPPIREKEPSEKDKNHSAEYMSDFRYNDMDWNWCYTLNGEFIGRDNIGIDQYAYEIDQTTRRKERIQNIICQQIINGDFSDDEVRVFFYYRLADFHKRKNNLEEPSIYK